MIGHGGLHLHVYLFVEWKHTSAASLSVPASIEFINDSLFMHLNQLS